MAAFGDPNLSDMQQHIHTHISHDPLMGHRPQTWVSEFAEKKILVLSIALRLSGYCCHSGLDPIGFRLIWDD